jgi:hypothetical protein
MIDEIIKTLKLETDYESVIVSESKELENPFDIMKKNDKFIIALPSNWKKLASESKLFALLIVAIQQLQYSIKELKEEFSPVLKLSKEQTNFLRTFGIPLVTKKIPKVPKGKGIFWKGLASAVKTYFDGKDKVDTSILTVKHAPMPAKVLFGTVWGKEYPREKKALDVILNCLHKANYPIEDLDSVILSAKTITEESGLQIDFATEVVSQNEKLAIDYYVSENKVELGYTIPPLLKDEDKIKYLVRMKADISTRQKALKPVKDLTKTLKSKRFTAIYAPYDSKGKKEKAKKLKINELLLKIKNTEHFLAFNPTDVFTLWGVGSMSMVAYNKTPKTEKFGFVEKYQTSLTDKKVPPHLINPIISEFLENSKLSEDE